MTQNKQSTVQLFLKDGNAKNTEGNEDHTKESREMNEILQQV